MSKNSSTFCVLPWIHLATHPHGAVSLCCIADHTNGLSMARNGDKGQERLLTLNQDSVAEIVNSDSFRKVRLQMLAGERPQACMGCYRAEEKGIESKRIYDGRRHVLDSQAAAKLTQADGTIQPRLRFIELRLGNLCNLKCRTCNPASSTKWREDYRRLQEQVDFIIDYSDVTDFSWPESESFWMDLLKYSDQLESIYINGGGPMLNKQHWSFLEGLVKSGRAREVELIYSTNMTLLPQKALDLWPKFRRVEIRASVDDLGERNSYIRYPAEWQAAVKTLNMLKAAGFEVFVLQTVSAMNFFYLDEFYKWAKEFGLSVAHNFVTEPAFLSAAVLPLSVRREILDRLKLTLPSAQYHALEQTYGVGENPASWTRFVTYTRELDRIRKQDFGQVFPELIALLRSRGVSW